MDSRILGRTNRAFPPIWLRPVLPRRTDDLDPLVNSLDELDLPLDISGQPGLWGGRLKRKDHFLTYVGSTAAENATSEQHASDLVAADLIQTLSSIGRDFLDVYFVRVRQALEEFQINGILEALESAREEGHLRYVGLCSDGNPFAALALWQFHDAFELLQVARNPSDEEAYKTLAPLANERRVGIVTSRPTQWDGDASFTQTPGEWLRPLTASYDGSVLEKAVITRLSMDHPVIVSVDSAEATEAALAEPHFRDLSEADALVSQIVHAYQTNSSWPELAQSSNPHWRRAARRHLERV